MTYQRSGDEQLSHRERKKLQTRRRIQATALGMAETTPYDSISVETVAAGSGVSPSTIFRYFTTKEGIFLWNEYDDNVMTEFRAFLGEDDPIQAMTKAVHSVLGGWSQVERDQALTQLALIESVEPLKNSAAAQLDRIRMELADSVADYGWEPLEANVFVGAMITAFNVAIETWVKGGGHQPLLPLFDRAIRVIGDPGSAR